MRSLVTLLVLLAYAAPVSAYLDPGSGSMLFASLFGIIATGLFFVRSAYYRLLSGFGRGQSRQVHTHGIVCYAEGSQYWSTFRPLVRSLNELSQGVTYLTSDRCDVAFDHADDLLTVEYIGEGNRAYARLNGLNADICILTTPGLDVLQIKRSKGVDQYVHVVHSSMDVHTYKLFSFDYYDVILCSGQHQIDSIRMLESKRNIRSKKLLLTGCLYFDDLVKKRDLSPKRINTPPSRRILIAPTWGSNGLLKRFGAEIIAPLVNSGFEVTIRPHPQSYVQERELLATLATVFGEQDNLTWDDSPDSFTSLTRADIMISDISGVMFDYVFLLDRPVITVAFEPDWLGTENFDMPTIAFELTVLDEIGKRIDPAEIPRLPQLLEEMLHDDENNASRIGTIRERMVANFGHGGPVAARQVLALTQDQADEAAPPSTAPLDSRRNIRSS